MATASKAPASKPSAGKAASNKPLSSKKPQGKKATNKSDAIRAYLDQHPNAGPTAVCKALKHQGISITPAHVSNVKAAAAKKAAKAAGIPLPLNGSGKRGRKPKAADAVSLGHLLEARRFAAQVGGVHRAMELLQSLAKLQ